MVALVDAVSIAIGITSLALKVGAAERSYLAFVPHNFAPGAPALIVLHGTGQTGNAIRAATGTEFEVLAQRHGFLVAYPDGMNQQWNDCRPKDEAGATVDDVGFVSVLIGDLSSRYGTDPSRTFLFGFSNGGQMVFRLLSEQPEHFAGAATMGANLPTAEYDLCDGDRATPRLLLAQSTEDPVVPF